MFFFWTGQFMYIGKAINTSIHDHHAIQIVLSFPESFEIILPGSSIKLKAALIDSDQPHECRTYDNTFLILNIAPESKIGLALKNNYLINQPMAELPAEKTSDFVETLQIELIEKKDSRNIFLITQKFLHTLSNTEELKSFDNRILEVLRLLDQQTDGTVRIADLAGKVFLSPSRLIHLFASQVGIPIRKYILWTRLLVALERILVSKNITEAALHAGFSDAPHLNKTFKRMFGFSPASLLKNSQIIQAYRN